jgi:hypothetical protein
MKFISLVLVISFMMMFSAASWAWDYLYDGSVLPNDPSLGANQWYVYPGANISECSTDGNVLHIEGAADFYKDALPGPITMESKVYVTGEPGYSAFMAIGSPSFSTYAVLYPGYLQVYFDYGNEPVTYATDMTTFHTLRIAINAQGQSYVWLDQDLVVQGITHVGGQGFVDFGGSLRSELGQSHWDYVAYSASFEPVPEPSSILALVGGITGLGGFALRRRRN